MKAKTTLKAFSLLFMLSLCGCVSQRLHFVQPTVPVQLAERIENVQVMVKEKASGEYVKATTDLLPGQWVWFDPKDWDTKRRVEAMDLRRDGD